jgi:hypothetical protein
MRLATFEMGVKHIVEGQDDYGNLIVTNQAGTYHAAMGHYPRVQRQELKKVTKKLYSFRITGTPAEALTQIGPIVFDPFNPSQSVWSLACFSLQIRC